ncbi:KinB-signaling pathway activation protein [Marinicrinis lubricantis]|uniref:KinB-signaling pathway activation protein n=1 Tax=Marinicrinis lubricantis TaxID=2086470 RepID=A0ABW1ISA5_9BACL
MNLNLKKWFYLFWTTLAVGAGASVITNLIVQIIDPHLEWNDIYVFLLGILMGLTYSVLSQMGFFSYLTVNYIAQGMMSKLTWRVVQWIFVIVVFVDLIALRHYFFGDESEGLGYYTILPVIMAVVAVLTAIMKVKMTNPTAFTPTVFFIFVVTVLEGIPAIRENNLDSTLNMMVPITACNVWQILILHKVLKKQTAAPNQ